ncbi:MAG: late competence development ComFB family protein [Aetokthonos hydrillicola CCALA 1050]|nr:late competence development ComFB family protein [Aetokthonos hydrillicola CCALA 1050]MBW4587709.1 late competence development ComFB family protein [Aetokthonos hydrillicola CCALA 1050]
MELLVVEEVEQQIKALPPKIAKYIKPVEVTAYALNRLPGLYATSQRGWQRQLNKGRRELSEQIKIAVRQAVIAVQRDLLRTEIPLFFYENEESAALATLQKLKILLQNQDLTWENLIDVVEESLVNALQGKITWRSCKHPDYEIFNWNEHPHYQ